MSSGDVSGDFATSDRTYLNNASVSIMPLCAVEAVGEFLLEYNAAGPDSKESARLVEARLAGARGAVSRMIGCRPDELVLTQSTTDGVNMVANGLRFGAGANIVIRGMDHEHHANLYPWLNLGGRASVRSLGIDADGFFAMDELRRLADADTGLVALSHALYNTGAVLPVGEAGEALGGTPYFVDAAQTVGCMEVDAPATGCDFMAFNGSKWLCGPMGTGLLYCRRGSEGLIEPPEVGGESAELRDGSLEFKGMPDRLQTGFRNYAGMAGLEASAGYLERYGIDRIRGRNRRLSSILRDELSRIPGVSLYGPGDPEARTSIVPFNVGGRDPQEVVDRLGAGGMVLAVREMGRLRCVRASPHLFNTEDEMARVAEAVRAL